jgi:hypothetical protein
LGIGQVTEEDVRAADARLALHRQMESQSAIQAHLIAAFVSGQKSKRNSWARISPFYEDRMRDLYFYAGYDGMTLAELHGAEN